MSASTLKNRIYADYLVGRDVKVGGRLPRIRELAGKYSVSVPTISKAVELLAAEGWVTKRRGSGMYVAKVGRTAGAANGASAHSRVGFVGSNLRQVLGLRLLEGIENVVSINNAVLEVANTRWRLEEERRQIEQMRDRGVQGIVLYPNAYNRGQAHEYLHEEYRDFPIVVVDLYEPDMDRPHVIFDNVEAGRRMTRHLLATGKRRIAFVCLDNTSYRSVDDRLRGYRWALQEAGFACDDELIRPVDVQHGAAEDNLCRVLDELLDDADRPDAIMLFHDPAALIAIRHLRSRGASVPEDIVVTGFDNIQDHLLDHWPTTNPDFRRMGERAAEMLFDRIMSRDNRPTESVLECPLLVSGGPSGITHGSFMPAAGVLGRMSSAAT